MNFYNRLSDTTKGIILMAVGLILLLHTLGVFTVLLGNILIIFAIALIVLGFLRADLYRKIMKMINKKKDSTQAPKQ